MKKFLFSLIATIFLSFLTLNVNALTDADCQNAADKAGGRCGYGMRACAIKSDGSCGVNIYYKELYEDMTCIDINEYMDKEIAATKCEVGTKKYACVWNKKYQFCNVDDLVYVYCEDSYDIPIMVPQVFTIFFNILKTGTPIILIIVGSITLLRALAASKEDEINKAKSSLIKKLIAAALIFFIPSIIQFVIFKVSDNHKGFVNCLNCFLNNNCKDTAYYKTTIEGEEFCTSLKEGSTIESCNNKFGLTSSSNDNQT